MAAEAHPTDRSGIRVSSVPRGAAARPPQPGAQRPHQGHPALAAEQEIRSAAAALSTCMHQMRQPKRPRDDEGAPEVQAEERGRVTEFVASVLDGRLRVRKGDLARELREFINPMRPPEFFEKLVSRRRLNDVLAAVLGPKVSRRARRQADQAAAVGREHDLERHNATLPLA
ncbi:hypothetical protein FNF27_04572 [Cafeteria roenbergensis]|uniref:Uncharacterized protein n=1 Tax=Cafeteria roenbergensis TaxID=33653 RepID=A0A5A8EDK5_CAFRO|nr:hypothetical protein FNF27_04572 [Cafeteria roenbergensis]